MVSVSLEKIIHFKNSLSAQLEAQKVRINILIISAHLSHSRKVHRNKETSNMKIGCGHSLIPRFSLCSMNTLNRHTNNTLISCYGLTISGSPWPLIANFKLNFNIQCTDFNQV